MAAAATDEARALAEALYGPGVCQPRHVSQVCAAVRLRQAGPLHVLAIGPQAPKSEHDFFALNFARARSAALLTSAQNLRSEPMLSHTLAGTYAAGLTGLRAALGHTEAPLVAILSASGDLPREHVAYRDGTPKLVLTTPEGAKALSTWADAPFQVVSFPELSARAALEWLKPRYTAVSIEAGPHTAHALYRAPSLVDELLLSRFEGALEPDAVGPALPDDATLFAGLHCVHRSERQEPSGRWVFERWLR